MKITVLYFAKLREAMERDREELELPADVTTVAALRSWLVARGAPWDAAFGETRRLRAAVNQDMARDDTPLTAGAEVAFFPPVTGG
ncbi:MAG: molybdopterin converting factor subunit 1 [Burkholderiales bacterium]|jgi:molybdopterin synthase sulfur carrier subunit|nr:molybdopterin converting factor subunit 1 [Burkholderiales bacterium]